MQDSIRCQLTLDMQSLVQLALPVGFAATVGCFTVEFAKETVVDFGSDNGSD